jgi:hypothetical protein
VQRLSSLVFRSLKAYHPSTLSHHKPSTVVVVKVYLPTIMHEEAIQKAAEANTLLIYKEGFFRCGKT